MTIFRGEGGGGDATTDSEINLITALANSIVADTAITTAAAASATASASAASTSETNAATSATNADLSAIASAASAAASLSSANNSASSAAAALVSENAAAASAASVNDTNLVHIIGTETITGAKTFSNTITGSITGNSGTVTNGVYTSGDQTIAGNKTFSSSIIGSITGNAATATNATTAASCSGNAGTVTNGVYTTGDQTIAGNKTFSNTILSSISGATGVFTGDVQATSYNGGQLAGLRNKIINGNMGIAQRGTAAVTTNGGYGPADRWLTNTSVNTFSTTQGSFVSGDTLYDTGGAQYFTQIAVTSVPAATNNTLFFQYIEDVRLLAGQTVTVSFWAKAAAGTPSIGVEIAQFFGSGGSPSALVTGTGQAQALTTTWTKYSKTFVVPSINGKTIGTTANTSSTSAVFWLDAGSNFNTRSGSIGQSSKTVSIAQVQLEVGSVATPFEFRPIGMELALCQRYYQANTYAITVAKNAVTQFMSFVWNVPFRTTPITITYSGFVDNDTSGATGITFSSPGANGASGFLVTGTTTVGSRLQVNSTISAEL